MPEPLPSRQSDDPFELRRAVGTWLRCRADDADGPGNAYLGRHMQNVDLANFLRQLAADADHSDLLVRLFSGQEPYKSPEDTPWRKHYNDQRRP